MSPPAVPTAPRSSTEQAHRVTARLQGLRRTGGDDRTGFVRSLAEMLAACEDVNLLRQHTDALVDLVRSDGDVLLASIHEATRSCGAGCSVRNFWNGVIRIAERAPATASTARDAA
jgi:hypothetical protein